MSQSKIECPSCAIDIDDDAETCPFCGYEIPQQKSGVKYVAWIIVLLMVWPLFKLLQALLG